MRRISKTVSLLALAAGAALAFALAAPPPARADGRPMVTPLPKYAQECGSCHLAFPPGALPAPSWQRLLRDLPGHFGTDASVDAPTLKELSTWLTAHAGSWKRVAEAPPQDRITTTAWFRRKHDDITPATYQRASVKSPANCAACHPRAEQGGFDDDRIRIPR